MKTILISLALGLVSAVASADCGRIQAMTEIESNHLPSSCAVDTISAAHGQTLEDYVITVKCKDGSQLVFAAATGADGQCSIQQR